MTLYFIGLGLCDEKDITVKGLEAVKRSDYIYLESYTSQLSVPVPVLEKYYGKKIIIADRELVEKNSDEILEKAKTKNVSFLVVGDIFSATTHTDLFLRAHEKGISCVFIHNASIMNAVAETGLDLYKFGRTTTLVFPEKNYFPDSPYDIIANNLKNNLHTLVLLDIKMSEKRFMTIHDALLLLLELEKKKKKKLFSEKTTLVGCARIGSTDAVIRYGTLRQLQDIDFGKPLHALIVPAKLHFVEQDALAHHACQ